MDEKDQSGGGYTDDDIEGRVPMRRFAAPEDVARAVAFLADLGQSGFVNGHTLSVDGGWFLGEPQAPQARSVRVIASGPNHAPAG